MEAIQHQERNDIQVSPRNCRYSCSFWHAKIVWLAYILCLFDVGKDVSWIQTRTVTGTVQASVFGDVLCIMLCEDVLYVRRTTMLL